MKATIKDIAKEAKVSVSAVSLVLNHKPCRVSKTTQEIIFSVAKKYNYTANQAARSLVTKKSNILGLIIPDIENLFFSSLSKKIEEYCRMRGYFLIIVNTNDHVEDDLLSLNLLVSRGVDGIFITASNEAFQGDQRLSQALQNLSIPYVMVDRYFEDLSCNKVFFDNEAGAMLAISHLVAKGHRKIGCIGSPLHNVNGRLRVLGYEKAMKDESLDIPKNYIQYGDYRFQSGYHAGQAVFENNMSAVFICNDMMTLGFLKYMNEHHLKVAQDISIVSYDNTLNPFLQGTEITSVDQNIERLATTSCDVLFENIEQKDAPKKTICLEPQLIVKDSVKQI